MVLKDKPLRRVIAQRKFYCEQNVFSNLLFCIHQADVRSTAYGTWQKNELPVEDCKVQI